MSTPGTPQTEERPLTRSRDRKREASPPAEYKDIWFQKEYVGRGRISGTVTKLLINGHPRENVDVYQVEYVDGDSELLTKEELDEAIANGKCDAPPGGLPKPARRSQRHIASDTEDDEATPRKRSKKRGGNKGRASGTPDSFYGHQYQVEELVDRKYEPALKYLVRWMGDWPAEEKETWEDVNNINPAIVKSYDKKHGPPQKPKMSSLEADKHRQEKLKALNDYKSLLEYLEPPSWSKAHKPIKNLSTDDLLKFPLSEFVKEYGNALAEVIHRKEGSAEDTPAAEEPSEQAK
eukprot:m.27600 g.27600  ORF g.27600 m.27600 type:complete len:292 (+) comp10280_c1_seq1:116-991(+)